MRFIRERALNGELMFGVGANLASSMTVELIGRAGFDWTWIDLEHGVGDHSEYVHQVQAAAIHDAAPVVRIAWNEAPRFKRVLDQGAAGIMVPYVNTAEEARAAAAAMRYPPDGVRGVAMSNRACGFGPGFKDYFAKANDNLLTVAQIETGEAVENAADIAAVEGIDVLFVGPLDLSVSLGVPMEFNHPDCVAARAKVAAACRKHGKAAGILIPNLDWLSDWVSEGYTFFVVGSDGGLVAKGLSDIKARCDAIRK